MDSLVERNDASDFFAHGPAGFAAKQVGALGPGGGGHFAQNLPFGAGFANLARELGAEHDAALGAGFGAAIILLVTGFGWEQKHFFGCRNEHLIGEDDVLVNAHGHIGHGAADEFRFGRRAQEIPAQTVEQIQIAASGGFNHLHGAETRLVGNGETIELRKGGGIFGVDWFTAEKSGGVRTHLGATLY